MGYSIITPTYNSAKYISKNITKLVRKLNNLKVIFELIIVNDGSSDDTKLIAERIIALSFYFLISIFSFIPDTNLYRELNYKSRIYPEFFRDFFLFFD